MAEYRICNRCVMDTTDPGVTFDEQGYCSACNTYLEQRAIRALAIASGSLARLSARSNGMAQARNMT